ncbi:MAG: SseB family protein [Hyphomonadaceae bacterium]|nr:SseB family protein [Hyphomonadaceae bacterium]MCA8885742.1 SseB family protein [Hyphomonadaceae bacterium]
MLRRSLLVGALGAWPALAFAQQTTTAPAQRPAGQAPQQPVLITPQNALETAFVSALNNEGMRPIFRRYLLETHVALALATSDDNSPPRQVRVRDGFTAGAIFTSEERLTHALGADAPHIMISGRAALTRLVGGNAVINPGYAPMLTLEPADLAAYLATPGESSAGPTQ